MIRCPGTRTVSTAVPPGRTRVVPAPSMPPRIRGALKPTVGSSTLGGSTANTSASPSTFASRTAGRNGSATTSARAEARAPSPSAINSKISRCRDWTIGRLTDMVSRACAPSVRCGSTIVAAGATCPPQSGSLAASAAVRHACRQRAVITEFSTFRILPSKSTKSPPGFPSDICSSGPRRLSVTRSGPSVSRATDVLSDREMSFASGEPRGAGCA